MGEAKKLSRHRKRISICEAIYSNLVLSSLNSNSTKYLESGFERKIYQRYIEQKEIYLSEINQLLKSGWDVDRLNLSILAVLLAIFTEYEVFKTAPAVLIHQAVELAKKYGEDDYKLVHALLDNYLKKFNNQKNNNLKPLSHNN
ncbi:transcription termination factor N-utilization substance protein B [Mycoplasma wenyonii str. Massachusetts]|uniref:Transcription termination factor N-utilization substance protein B n=1 Tax=Mycoplasma wenyonii (strain Massachusetts) TaxID=1197325 RepID=I6YL30_MYCWM|nr:transcription antitermination factor NusB [Mycoplasma wenyonii]AFN64954.1 transcription termination factor N-utilization substance protein B [Mycoplasma wenyonii str. Massachusetts]